ncbi:hypothetical protein [Anaerophilus nitritogenes]|uniref:hypothetical protein n=1 Tax=Anaerophilus nitritogenes TaxID=2498136 RepID=UPI00101BD68E|nr:hypothetical protein [Anaerophilus nitritogenes]
MKKLEYICMDLNRSLIQTHHQTVDKMFIWTIENPTFRDLFEVNNEYRSTENVEDFSNLFSLETSDNKIKKGACNLNKFTISKDNKELTIYYFKSDIHSSNLGTQEGYFLYLTEFRYI